MRQVSMRLTGSHCVDLDVTDELRGDEMKELLSLQEM